MDPTIPIVERSVDDRMRKRLEECLRNYQQIVLDGCFYFQSLMVAPVWDESFKEVRSLDLCKKLLGIGLVDVAEFCLGRLLEKTLFMLECLG